MSGPVLLRDARHWRTGERVSVLHPSLMYRLFGEFWSGHRAMGFLDAHTRYEPVSPPVRIVELVPSVTPALAAEPPFGAAHASAGGALLRLAVAGAGAGGAAAALPPAVSGCRRAPMPPARTMLMVRSGMTLVRSQGPGRRRDGLSEA